MQAVRARGRGAVVVRSLKIKQKSVLTCGFEMIQVLLRVVAKERNLGFHWVGPSARRGMLASKKGRVGLWGCGRVKISKVQEEIEQRKRPSFLHLISSALQSASCSKTVSRLFRVELPQLEKLEREQMIESVDRT